MTTSLSPAAFKALSLLIGTSITDTCSAKGLANLMWPEKIADCRTSLRRGGLYRAAGAYFSKLEKRGLCRYHIDDFDSGYYLTAAGLAAVRHAQSQPDNCQRETTT